MNGKWFAIWQTEKAADAIADRRYQAEVAGITISGMRVETDDRAKLLINGAAVEAMLDADYAMQWKTSGALSSLPVPRLSALLAQSVPICRRASTGRQSCWMRLLMAPLQMPCLSRDGLWHNAGN